LHVLLDDAVVRLVDGHLAVAVPDAPERRVRLDEVGQLSLFGAASVTSPCLRELMWRGIPVVWRAHGGHYVGQSADLSRRGAAARRAQYRAADDPVRALAIARTEDLDMLERSNKDNEITAWLMSAPPKPRARRQRESSRIRCRQRPGE
jgi:CRISPR/Cas system-associated endonuclease Cas1